MARSEYGTLPPPRCWCRAFMWRYMETVPNRPVRFGRWHCALHPLYRLEFDTPVDGPTSDSDFDRPGMWPDPVRL